MKQLIAILLVWIFCPQGWGQNEVSLQSENDDGLQKIIDVAERNLKANLAPYCQEIALSVKREPWKKVNFNPQQTKLSGRVPAFTKPEKRMIVWVDHYNDGQRLKSWLVEFEVSCLANVWVTRTEVGNGEVLSQRNCTYQLADISELAELPLKEIEGVAARRRLTKAMIVTPQLSKPIEAITKDKSLSLIVKNGSVTLNLLAIALMDGQPGEKIWVKPIGIGKAVQAEIVDNDTVMVR